MSTGELIHAYKSADQKRANIFGVPGGALKPAEAAGELIKQFEHQGGLVEASQKICNNPDPWNFCYQAHCVLSSTTAWYNSLGSVPKCTLNKSKG